MRFKGKKPIFSRKDCWSLGHTLDPIIGAGLQKFYEELIRLREEGHAMRGCPGSIMKNDDDDFEESYQKWIDIVQEMVYAFTVDEPNYTGKIEFMEGEPNEEGLIAFNTRVDEKLWAEHMEECKAHHARVKAGRELFIKHYDDLWW